MTFPSGQEIPRPPIQPPSRPPTIKVVINTPQIKIVEIGETTEFNCNGYYIINNVSRFTFERSYSLKNLQLSRLLLTFAGTNTMVNSHNVYHWSVTVFSSKMPKLTTAVFTFVKLKLAVKLFAIMLHLLLVVSLVKFFTKLQVFQMIFKFDKLSLRNLRRQ